MAYENLTLAALAALFNEGQEELGLPTIKKFADRASAERRLSSQQEAIAKKNAELAAELPKKTSGGGRGRKTDINLAGMVTLLVEANPKRKPSRSYDIFGIYVSGMVANNFVEQVVAMGHPRKLALDTLRWDVAHGFISID